MILELHLMETTVSESQEPLELSLSSLSSRIIYGAALPFEIGFCSLRNVVQISADAAILCSSFNLHVSF